MAKAKAPAKEKRTYKPRVKPLNDGIGPIAVPGIFEEQVEGLQGVELLKALHYLNAGERIGREDSGGVGDKLSDIRRGVAAVMERMVNAPQSPQSHGLPPAPATGLDTVTMPSAIPGYTQQDLQEVRDHCMACAGGNEEIADMAYDQSIAKMPTGRASRWHMIVEARVQAIKDAFAGEGQDIAVPGMGEDISEFDPLAEEEQQFDDGD